MALRPNSPRADTIAARRQGRRVALREFDESKVTRDDTGKFGTGSGGGAKPKPKTDKPGRKPKKPKQTPEERAAAQQAQASANREAVGDELNATDNEQISKAGIDSLAAIRQGAPDQNADDLIGKGLAVRGRDGRVRLTPDGKKILSAADKGDTQGVLDAVSEAGDRRAAGQERQAAREAKRAEREAKRAAREAARAAKKPKGEAAAKPSKGGGGGGKREPGPLVGGRTLDLGALRPATKAMRPGRRRLWRAAYAEAKAAGHDTAGARQAARVALRADTARKATQHAERARLAVFKDARGRDRWAAISSTAYRDRDGEIVSSAALKGAVALADAAGQGRGPLRFWHAPGLDLGDCDFQAVVGGGRVLIESGTFRRPAYAQAVKAVADGYQMSIGFTHPATEPDPAGVFHTIQIFERSLVPAGRASNPFTRITTKGRPMDIAPDKLQALKALLGDAGAAELLSGAAQTDKAAQAAGVAFKSADAPAVYTLPDGTPGVIVGGVFQALKAAGTTEKAPMPPAAMMQAAMTEAGDAAADAAAEGAELDEAAGISDDTDLMDLTVGDFKAVFSGFLDEALAGYNAKMADMKSQYEAMGKAFGALQSAQAQKDDSAAAQAAELASLKQQQEAIAARLKELEGDAAPAARRAQLGEPSAVVPAPAAATVKAATTPEQDAYNLIFGAAV